MPEEPVTFVRDGALAIITLNDADRRNALGLAMFDGLAGAIAAADRDESARVVLLQGSGPVLCAGFDLAAAVEDPEVMAEYIRRLSRTNRALRRLPQPVVIAVHGAAIAGGCALLGAGDVVVMADEARVGYPVHRIGVSPAVTIPTLMQAVGPGAARELLMSGRLIDGIEARRIGLATHLVASGDDVIEAARSICECLAAKPPRSLRITKAWLNELDGSLEDDRFDRPVEGSIGLTSGAEAQELLRGFWEARQGR